MPHHLISDPHEWINKIPTVPTYYQAKPQPREQAWNDQQGKKTCWAWLLSNSVRRHGKCSIGGRKKFFVEGSTIKSDTYWQSNLSSLTSFFLCFICPSISLSRYLDKLLLPWSAKVFSIYWSQSLTHPVT